MDHAETRVEHQLPKGSPTPKPDVGASPEQDLLELQRTAGNRAVTEAITTVQRHRLNPENIEESPPG
jgi:hypothetical protein